MRTSVILLVLLLLTLLPACGISDPPGVSAEPTIATVPVTVPLTLPPEPETTAPSVETETSAPPAEPVILTEKEKTMLLKLGMAERGDSGCTECIALVMRSVLNRVEAGHFRSIRSAIFAQDQYTPVSDGSYYSAQPNEQCYEALEMVICGWDESQGALFYEWCEGNSWHQQKLHLLFQHCDTRFYD